MLAALLCILTSYGCQSTPPDRPPAVVDADSLQDATAQQLIDRALRTMDPAESAALYAAAARLQYKAGDLSAAQSTLAHVDLRQLGPDDQFNVRYVRAALALSDGNIDLAGAELDAAIPSSAEQQHEYLRLRARTYSARGDHVQAAARLMDLAELLAQRQLQRSDDANAWIQDLHDEIWAAIGRAPMQRIPVLASESGNPVHRGWWALAAAMTQSFDLAAQRVELEEWRRSHRRHPAANTLPSQLRHMAEQMTSPQHVALMLPLSGPLANAGHAVRDGFLSALFHSEGDMTVSVYDTNTDSVAALYEEALYAGAELIVGPLDRTSLTQLVALGPRLPVLGLNYLAGEHNGEPGLLQFSLAIEHESEAIARQLMDQGIERVLLFYAGNDWSQRARLAFRNRFSEFGGTILVEDFFASSGDITPAVGNALLIERSSERHAALARLFGASPEFMPRRREDVEAVVAFVDATQARGLKPALAYHFASNIPVFTSSQALQNLSSSAWRELDGMHIAQIPWRVHPTAVRTQLNNHFPDSRGDMLDLYAFGVDAWRIADRYESFVADADARLDGGTGILRVGEDGRITRELVWTRMRGGNLLPTANGAR